MLKISWQLGQNEMESTIPTTDPKASIAAFFASGGIWISETQFVTWNSIATIEVLPSAPVQG